TFTKKFGIRRDAEICLDLEVFFYKVAQPFAGSNRYGRFSYKHLVSVHRLGYVFRGLAIITHIGRAVFFRRSTYSKKDDQGLPNGCLYVGREMKTSGFGVLFDNCVQARLINWNDSLI